jgi:Ca2+-binding EF-hand superfamily protein
MKDKIEVEIKATNVSASMKTGGARKSRLALLRDCINAATSIQSDEIRSRNASKITDDLISRMQVAFTDNQIQKGFFMTFEKHSSLSIEGLERVIREVNIPEFSVDVPALFTLLDEDGNGTVDKRELFAAFAFLLAPYCAPQMQMEFLFTAYDFDNNGVLDKDEFQSLIDALGVPQIKKSEDGKVAHVDISDSIKASDRLTSLFDTLDLDHNGKLSKEEFLKGLQSDATLANLFLGQNSAKDEQIEMTSNHDTNLYLDKLFATQNAVSSASFKFSGLTNWFDLFDSNRIREKKRR